MSNTIIEKLKVEKYKEKLILNMPEDVRDFDGIVYDTEISKSSYDLVLSFIFSIEEFTCMLKTVINKQLLNLNGYLYFVYPKKKNRKYEESIGRDDFFVPSQMDEDGYVMESHLKFNRMIAYSEVFTCIGLKYIPYNLNKTPAVSQCVDDYLEHVNLLKLHFEEKDSHVLSLYDGLTPGYQRDWARYVYGTKSEHTMRKRLKEMSEVMQQGYKTIDHFRKSNRQKSSKPEME